MRAYARPVEIGLGPGQHLLVLGNSGGGRSGLLRSFAASLQQRGERSWLVDPRRLLSAVAEAAFRRAISPAETAALVAKLIAACRPAERTRRNVLIVDDQALVGGRSGRGDAAGVLAALARVAPFRR